MKNLTRILCPIELTPEAVAPLRYALLLAQDYGAKLVVCHCPATAAPAALQEVQGQMQELVVQAWRETDAEEQGGVVLASGNDVALAITREAAERQVELIVMQSRRRPLAAALLGSVAEAVCRSAPCPVLVLHPEEHPTEAAPLAPNQPRRILVAHDFSASASLALDWGAAFAQQYQAELHLLHIVLPDTYLDLEYEPELLASGQGVIADLTRDLKRDLPSDVALASEVKIEIRRGKPAPEILSYVRQEQIDLLCIGAHDDSKPRGLFGSNADWILRQATCPTLLAQ